MTINVQEHYEDILSDHWHRLVHLKELIDTDTSRSALRRDSIRKRQSELDSAVLAKKAMETLFGGEFGDLVVPDWYLDRVSECTAR